MLEKANRLQDPKKRTAPPGNPKDSKNRTTGFNALIYKRGPQSSEIFGQKF